MDVEMTDNSGNGKEPEVEMNGCDTKQNHSVLDLDLEPSPKFVSDAELRLLQVSTILTRSVTYSWAEHG